MTITDDIRSGAAWVIDCARYVKINFSKIDEYAAFLLGKYPLISSLDSKNHLVSKDPENIASYVLALDSVNFGSAYYAEAQKEGIYIEYDVIAASLKKSFEIGQYVTPISWVKMTSQDCHDLFLMPQNKISSLDELMSLCASHLRQTGEKLVNDYQGSALNFLNSNHGSAVTLVEKIAQWDSFKDISFYQGRPIPVMKRAQIVAADLHLAFHFSPERQFQDIDQLTSFADNIVPHVLRHDDLLMYAPELDQKINSGVLIPSGSEEEVEMRCAAIHTVELIKASARQQGHHVTAVNIDHLLWHRGHEPEVYRYPSHRTKSIFY